MSCASHLITVSVPLSCRVLISTSYRSICLYVVPYIVQHLLSRYRSLYRTVSCTACPIAMSVPLSNRVLYSISYRGICPSVRPCLVQHFLTRYLSLCRTVSCTALNFPTAMSVVYAYRILYRISYRGVCSSVAQCLAQHVLSRCLSLCRTVSCTACPIAVSVPLSYRVLYSMSYRGVCPVPGRALYSMSYRGVLPCLVQHVLLRWLTDCPSIRRALNSISYLSISVSECGRQVSPSVSCQHPALQILHQRMRHAYRFSFSLHTSTADSTCQCEHPMVCLLLLNIHSTRPKQPSHKLLFCVY